MDVKTLSKNDITVREWVHRLVGLLILTPTCFVESMIEPAEIVRVLYQYGRFNTCLFCAINV